MVGTHAAVEHPRAHGGADCRQALATAAGLLQIMPPLAKLSRVPTSEMRVMRGAGPAIPERAGAYLSS
jgi:hypothetical protein